MGKSKPNKAMIQKPKKAPKSTKVVNPPGSAGVLAAGSMGSIGAQYPPELLGKFGGGQ